jgi:hypothetical protein
MNLLAAFLTALIAGRLSISYPDDNAFVVALLANLVNVVRIYHRPIAASELCQ